MGFRRGTGALLGSIFTRGCFEEELVRRCGSQQKAMLDLAWVFTVFVEQKSVFLQRHGGGRRRRDRRSRGDDGDRLWKKRDGGWGEQGGGGGFGGFVSRLNLSD